jgi:hypothetical protein
VPSALVNITYIPTIRNPPLFTFNSSW